MPDITFTTSVNRKQPLKISKGQRFGKLTVLEPFVQGKIATSRCLCDCGTTKDIARSSLANGATQSCGCIWRNMIQHNHPMQKHGCAKGRRLTKEYALWEGIKNRCYNTRVQSYRNYGARGITVCERWMDSFDAFLSDVGYAPSRSHSLDRIDNNGNYEPGNVKWSTPSQQARNKRTNRLVTFNGVTKCVAEWCDQLGLSRHLIYQRLENGWTPEKALTTPVRKTKVKS